MYSCTKVSTSHWTIGSTARTASSKKASKNIAEYIAKIHTREVKSTGTATAIFKCSVSKLIVLTSLIWIRKNRISF